MERDISKIVVEIQRLLDEQEAVLKEKLSEEVALTYSTRWQTIKRLAAMLDEGD